MQIKFVKQSMVTAIMGDRARIIDILQELGFKQAAQLVSQIPTPEIKTIRPETIYKHPEAVTPYTLVCGICEETPTGQEIMDLKMAALEGRRPLPKRDWGDGVDYQSNMFKMPTPIRAAEKTA